MAMPEKIKNKRPRGRPKQAFRMRRVTLTLDPSDWKSFEKLGRDSSMSTALLIRLAMKEFLQRRRNGRSIAVKMGSSNN